MKILLFISEGDKVLDLDSGNFTGNKWGLYKQVLMDGIGKYEYILVVPTGNQGYFKQLNIPYYIIYPDKS